MLLVNENKHIRLLVDFGSKYGLKGKRNGLLLTQQATLLGGFYPELNVWIPDPMTFLLELFDEKTEKNSIFKGFVLEPNKVANPCTLEIFSEGISPAFQEKDPISIRVTQKEQTRYLFCGKKDLYNSIWDLAETNGKP
jgi:hypothetical protein